MIEFEHPDRKDKIVNIRDTAFGYRGTWIKPDGTEVPVEGTWALGVPISWSYKTGKVSDTGFEEGQYLVICGHWQI